MNSDSFFQHIPSGQITRQLLDTLPDTIAYVKDLTGVYQHVNRAFAATLERPPGEIIGRLDADLFRPELVKLYLADDARVLAGETISEKAELVTHRPGFVRWYITNKIPLRNGSGDVIGLAGLSRPSKSHLSGSTGLPATAMERAITHVHTHMEEQIDLEQLARVSGVSVSSLERQFKSALQTSPGKFVQEVKVSRACELLADSSLTVYQVGQKVGYPEPVVFCRAFKRHMGITPKNYRNSLQTSIV